MNNKKYVLGAIALAVLSLSVAMPAFADDNNQRGDINVGSSLNLNLGVRNGDKNDNEQEGGRGGMMGRGIFGTVSAISGNTITVSGKQGFGTNAVSTTFTVDATNAKIMKDGVAGTVASIAVGDTVMVQGSVTGTNIAAVMIRDGKMPMMRKGGDKNPPISPITGDGNPIVAGTVSAVSGSTITITNKSNVTYTINASSAKIVKGANTASVSDIAVGDMVIAQGTINGNAVVATSVIDQSKPVTNTGGDNKGEGHGGFFSGVGAFFSHLFGF